ncbi:MAG TPA: fibronectin type III domain-containing protein [Nitrospiria bacterium]|nr:fibronectin type III domain-containing protein [Nitrospiria bacterium]
MGNRCRQEIPLFFTLVSFLLILLTPSLGFPGSWEFSLNISVQDPSSHTGWVTNRLKAGADPLASQNYDNAFDGMALLAGPLQAAFSHEGEAAYPPHLQQLWNDFRDPSLPQEWKIVVKSTQNSEPVLLDWAVFEEAAPDSCTARRVTLTDETALKDIDLETGSTYSFSSSGTRTAPETRIFTLAMDIQPQNGPSAPARLSASLQRSRVSLSWSPPEVEAVSGFHVWRSSGDGPLKRLTRRPILTNSFEDRDLNRRASYRYAVTAVGVNGCESLLSNEIFVSFKKSGLR